MRPVRRLTMTIVLCFSAVAASAQDPNTGSANPAKEGHMKMGGMTSSEGKMAHGDMMGKGGMMGKSGMMGEGGMMCPMGRYLLPQLPEGNEQLQLQMQAEVLRSIAEISSKYANMVAEGKGS